MSRQIAIIGTVGLPAKYGGFETLVEYLTKELSKKYEIIVYCSSRAYNEKLQAHNGATLKYINLKANGIQSVPYDVLSIVQSCRVVDTLLILGVSGCIALPMVRWFSSSKIIVNIDGLEWRREKWNKYAKWFLKFSEKLAVSYSDVIITDNKVIQDYVQSEYGVKSELIAYGSDHAEKEKIDLNLLSKYPFLDNKYAFSVCRIEPENNIHVILEAAQQLEIFPLVIIGNWNASHYGSELKQQYMNYDHIHLVDPIYDQKKLDMIRSNCYVYLHGHSAGGTNPSLVEAMNLGLPIIAYGANYNKETTDNKALYFDNSSELKELLSGVAKDELRYVAERMREIAKKKYTWKNISNSYESLF
jgi:glycosyltransferase involved in cell wall biosynthesis